MKYEHLDFSGALPDAPLAMPKQQLERRRSLFGTLRAMFAAFPRFQA